MRHILTGTVTQKQLDDAGQDLRDSYFGPEPETKKLLVMDGLDFRGRDLRNVTMVDGYVSNCEMSTARTDYLYTRRMQWAPDNEFPIDCSSSICAADMVAAIIYKYVVSSPNDTLAMVRDHVNADLMHSWNDSFYRATTEKGFTPEQIKMTFGAAFAGYPKLMARLEKVVNKGDFKPPAPYEKRDNGRYPLPGGRMIDFNNLPVPKHRDDRWEMERLMEKRHGGCHVHFYILEPWVVWAARSEYGLPDPTPWGWWQDMWKGT